MFNNDYGFKFKIGDIVIHIGSSLIQEEDKIDSIFRMGQEKLLIVGRILDECPGGIQRHYDCRPIINKNPATKLVRFNEIELKKE